ncbi:DNA repair protein RAD51 homolog 3-like [Poeciliopsis prolifica]|uniref:DNA repair protein RAD51 homolog 3-like n=1 Tax=Poeciliopsis prolifica TaxID=188132 RepID=UPI00241462D9|nr:DNA repair protein RAD51 homolog 3-like [Poeciliopsis prolifica]
MRRPVSSLGLGSSLKGKLVRAGFQFTTDLQDLNPEQLSAEAGVSQQEALEALHAASAGHGGAPVTALELLQREEEFRSIVTFCSRLDEALGGGVPVGKVTEICGAPGVGKTQLCLQLAVDVQVPAVFGGLGGQVLFVDTEGGFRVQRLVDLAGAAVRRFSLLAEDEEQRVAMATFTVETILSNVFLGFLVRCRDYVELLAELRLLPDFLSDRPRLRLLVIDSVAFPFLRLHDDLSRRTRLLQGVGLRLIAAATGHNIAVVTTNHTTTRLRGGRARPAPALGDIWGHAPSVRLLLRWEESRRMASILKSPGHMDSSVQYQITCQGFRDADQSEQPQSKRPRTQTDQSASSRKNTVT